MKKFSKNSKIIIESRLCASEHRPCLTVTPPQLWQARKIPGFRPTEALGRDPAYNLTLVDDASQKEIFLWAIARPEGANLKHLLLFHDNARVLLIDDLVEWHLPAVAQHNRNAPASNCLEESIRSSLFGWKFVSIKKVAKLTLNKINN